jgi:hypothetical protein
MPTNQKSQKVFIIVEAILLIDLIDAVVVSSAIPIIY